MLAREDLGGVPDMAAESLVRFPDQSFVLGLEQELVCGVSVGIGIGILVLWWVYEEVAVGVCFHVDEELSIFSLETQWRGSRLNDFPVVRGVATDVLSRLPGSSVEDIEDEPGTSRA